MDVQINIPDEIFQLDDPDISRQVLKHVALEGYRSHQLTTGQIQRLLGFSTRMQVHEFLKEHGVPWVDYPLEDAEREHELLKKLFPA